MILVDIENLAGTPTPTAHDVKLVMAALAELVPGFDEAHLEVACSHRAARTVAFACPPARHHWRSGPNGADLALQVLEDEHVADRFEYVTLCSGDGIFTAVTARLAEHGVDTTVVALKGHLAARLELAARRVAYLPPAAALAPTGSAS
jgi:NYN domain